MDIHTIFNVIKDWIPTFIVVIILIVLIFITPNKQTEAQREKINRVFDEVEIPPVKDIVDHVKHMMDIRESQISEGYQPCYCDKETYYPNKINNCKVCSHHKTCTGNVNTRDIFDYYL